MVVAKIATVQNVAIAKGNSFAMCIFYTFLFWINNNELSNSSWLFDADS